MFFFQKSLNNSIRDVNIYTQYEIKLLTSANLEIQSILKETYNARIKNIDIVEVDDKTDACFN